MLQDDDFKFEEVPFVQAKIIPQVENWIENPRIIKPTVNVSYAVKVEPAWITAQNVYYFCVIVVVFTVIIYRSIY